MRTAKETRGTKARTATTEAKPSAIFSLSDTINLIAACKQAGVRHFKFKSLEISFVGDAPEGAVPEVPFQPEYPLNEQINPGPGKDPETEKLIVRQRYLSELMLADPAAYEAELEADELSQEARG